MGSLKLEATKLAIVPVEVEEELTILKVADDVP